MHAEEEREGVMKEGGGGRMISIDGKMCRILVVFDIVMKGFNDMMETI